MHYWESKNVEVTVSHCTRSGKNLEIGSWDGEDGEGVANENHDARKVFTHYAKLQRNLKTLLFCKLTLRTTNTTIPIRSLHGTASDDIVNGTKLRFVPISEYELLDIVTSHIWNIIKEQTQQTRPLNDTETI